MWKWIVPAIWTVITMGVVLFWWPLVLISWHYWVG